MLITAFQPNSMIIKRFFPMNRSFAVNFLIVMITHSDALSLTTHRCQHSSTEDDLDLAIAILIWIEKMILLQEKLSCVSKKCRKRSVTKVDF